MPAPKVAAKPLAKPAAPAKIVAPPAPVAKAPVVAPKTPAKKAPSADAIKARAEAIWKERVRLGKAGDEIGDWLQAERELKA